MEILIVEDEPSIRVLLERVLARSGYSVRACATSEEALTADGSSGYKLAIIDYSLPGMDGLTLIAELRQRQPGLPVILCSGMPLSPPVFDPPVQFVHKPYRPRQLTDLVTAAILPGQRAAKQ